MAASKKIEEGTELMKAAEKSLKTNLLKWRPDYDSAADEYNKAATAFRIAKSYELSNECLLKAIECYKNNKSWFHAAKCYDQLIIILKETNNFSKIEDYSNRACNLYLQHGSPESAAGSLDKSAKLVEQKNPEIALRFYQRALDIVMGEDSTRQASEIASKVSRTLVKLRMYDEAADSLRREICLNQQTESYGQIGRLTVALILIQLARGDLVAAEKAFKEWGNCCDAEEVRTLETLLQAYDDDDSEEASKALSSPFIKHMDVEYSILARELSLPKNNKTQLPSGYTNVENTSSVATENEDFGENGLC